MILAIEQNLKRGVHLLENISDSNYSDTSIAPYYSSIGVHMRHILDVFHCVFNGLPEGKINLINRQRNVLVEENRNEGIVYFEDTIAILEKLKEEDFGKIVLVTDDLGNGAVELEYTLGAILAQAHSHAIHHFASVGYVISQLGIEFSDAMFGLNPTTPKSVSTK